MGTKNFFRFFGKKELTNKRKTVFVSNMSLRLPPPNSPLRETFAIEDLVNFKNIPDFRVCVRALRKTVEDPMVRSAHGVCWLANGNIVLVRCGKRGGIKQLFNFGNPYRMNGGKR